MGKLFWVVNIVFLAGALALWGVGTLGVRSEATGRANEISSRESEVMRLSKAKLLPNEKFIDYAKQREELLKKEKSEIKKVMLSRDLNVAKWEWGENPPPGSSELAPVRKWLEGQYLAKNKVLTEADIIHPEGEEVESRRRRGEVDRWEDFGEADIPVAKRELIVMREIYSALAKAGAKVTYESSQEVGRGGTAETVLHEVDELKSVTFGTGRSRGGRGRAGDSKAEGEKDASGPQKIHLVTVTFLSHLDVVPDVIRRVENRKRVLFVTRSTTIKRPGMRFGPRGVGQPQGRGDPTEEKHLRNLRTREAPVEAEVTFGFYEFPLAREGQS